MNKIEVLKASLYSYLICLLILIQQGILFNKQNNCFVNIIEVIVIVVVSTTIWFVNMKKKIYSIVVILLGIAGNYLINRISKVVIEVDCNMIIEVFKLISVVTIISLLSMFFYPLISAYIKGFISGIKKGMKKDN